MRCASYALLINTAFMFSKSVLIKVIDTKQGYLSWHKGYNK